jgi:mitogen-activated protein kinase 1/3
MGRMLANITHALNTLIPKRSKRSHRPDDEMDCLTTVTIEKEIFEIPAQYKIFEMRGNGSYGVVVSAKDRKTNRKVAIKKNKNVFPRTIAPGMGDKVSQTKLPHRSKLSQKRILRELKILIHLRNHPNIINLYDVLPPPSYEAFGDIYFVTDLMEADMRDILESQQELTEQHVQYFMYQILLAVHFWQSANIVHRDLKPENILLNSNCELKICDFGLARGIDFEGNPAMSTAYVQTRWYRAPELLLNSITISKQTDLWSVGCIMAELLGRKVLFRGTSPIDQMHKILDVLGTPNIEDIKGSEEGVKFVLEYPYKKPQDLATLLPNASKDAIDLLSKMLVFNPDKRITTDEALAHPFFKELFDESDIKVCPPFDFSFENELDTDDQALKRCAYESILAFRQCNKKDERMTSESVQYKHK